MLKNTLNQLNTDPAKGLNQGDADGKLKEFGYNEVLGKKSNLVLLFFKKFWGITAWMLEIIIILSWFLHKHSDSWIVLGLLLFNAIIGFVQEYNAANAVEALKKKLQINVKLLRDGAWKTLAARELVPGDIIRIRIGDFVPADVKIIQGDISVDQSALTLINTHSVTPFTSLRTFGNAILNEEKNGNSFSITQAWTTTGIVRVNSLNALAGLLATTKVTAIQFRSFYQPQNIGDYMRTNFGTE